MSDFMQGIFAILMMLFFSAVCLFIAARIVTKIIKWLLSWEWHKKEPPRKRRTPEEWGPDRDYWIKQKKKNNINS